MEQRADRVTTRVQAAITAARTAMHEVYTAVAELDAHGAAATVGYRDTPSLLGDALRIDPAEAKRLLARADQLIATVALTGEPLPPQRPAAAAASAAGTVSDGHLAVVERTLRHLADVPGLDAEVLAEAETALVEHAATLAPAGLAKVALRIVQQLDPDGAAPVDDPAPADELHRVRRRDGSLFFKGRIHHAADAELITEVFDALGVPAGADDPRTRPERDAEVLTELCALAATPTGLATDTTTATDTKTATDAATTAAPAAAPLATDEPADDDDSDGPDGAEPRCRTVAVSGRALLAVTIDHRWLQARVGHGLLDSDQPIDPATARRLACDAGIVPMVLGARGEPLDVGRASYTVPEAIRRALHVRDGGCTFPGCTRRPRRCHAHHIQHWADHGVTALHNLTLLCPHHHQLVHHDHWTITMTDGRPWYTPPPAVDPHQRPRPGGRFPPHKRPGHPAAA